MTRLFLPGGLERSLSSASFFGLFGIAAQYYDVLIRIVF